jgi:hypothetical protein
MIADAYCLVRPRNSSDSLLISAFQFSACQLLTWRFQYVSISAFSQVSSFPKFSNHRGEDGEQLVRFSE